MPDRVSDSALYVYAIVLAQDVPDESSVGVDDAPLEYVEAGPLAAVVSQVGANRYGAVRSDLVAHTRTLDWLASRLTIIPVAFGTIIEDFQALILDVLEPAAEPCLELLAKLRGCAQFNLRGVYVRERVLEEVVLAQPELTDLHRRTRDLPPGQLHPDLVRLGEGVSAALEQRRLVDSERILGAVAPHVTDIRDRVGRDMDQVFNVAMLIPHSHRQAVESMLEDLAEAEHERVRLQLTGPFPAYDFVGELSWVS